MYIRIMHDSIDSPSSQQSAGGATAVPIATNDCSVIPEIYFGTGTAVPPTCLRAVARHSISEQSGGQPFSEGRLHEGAASESNQTPALLQALVEWCSMRNGAYLTVSPTNRPPQLIAG